jgi:hypothetical protein
MSVATSTSAATFGTLLSVAVDALSGTPMLSLPLQVREGATVSEILFLLARSCEGLTSPVAVPPELPGASPRAPRATLSSTNNSNNYNNNNNIGSSPRRLATAPQAAVVAQRPALQATSTLLLPPRPGPIPKIETPRAPSQPPSARSMQAAETRVQGFKEAQDAAKAATAGKDFFASLKVLREYERRTVMSEAERKDSQERHHQRQLEDLDAAWDRARAQFDEEWAHRAKELQDNLDAQELRLEIAHETEATTLENTIAARGDPPPKFSPQLINLRRMAELQGVAGKPELSVETTAMADSLEAKEREVIDRNNHDAREKKRSVLRDRHERESRQLDQRIVGARFKHQQDKKAAFERLQLTFRNHRQDIIHAHALELARKPEPTQAKSPRRPVTSAASMRGTNALTARSMTLT